jgi:hypothetical protein
MRKPPGPAAPAPYRPRPAIRRRTAAVLAAALCAGLLAGCSDTAGAVDAGHRISPPPAPEPLWSIPPRPDDPPPDPDPDGPDPIPGIAAPPTGRTEDIDLPGLIDADRGNIRDDLVDAVFECGDRDCGLRRPVHRDLTGDGKAELLLFIDPDPRYIESLVGIQPPVDSTLFVYRIDGKRIYNSFILEIPAGMGVELQDRALVTRINIRPDGATRQQVQIERYEWDTERTLMEQTARVTGPAPDPPRRTRAAARPGPPGDPIAAPPSGPVSGAVSGSSSGPVSGPVSVPVPGVM